jgi:hypothetical protein
MKEKGWEIFLSFLFFAPPIILPDHSLIYDKNQNIMIDITEECKKLREDIKEGRELLSKRISALRYLDTIKEDVGREEFTEFSEEFLETGFRVGMQTRILGVKYQTLSAFCEVLDGRIPDDKIQEIEKAGEELVEFLGEVKKADSEGIPEISRISKVFERRRENGDY